MAALPILADHQFFDSPVPVLVELYHIHPRNEGPQVEFPVGKAPFQNHFSEKVENTDGFGALQVRFNEDYPVLNGVGMQLEFHPVLFLWGWLLLGSNSQGTHKAYK